MADCEPSSRISGHVQHYIIDDADLHRPAAAVGAVGDHDDDDRIE